MAIQEYMLDVSKDEFVKDKKLQDAVYMRIIALAEHVAKLLSYFSVLETGHPGMRWNSLVSLRNRIAHEYFFH